MASREALGSVARGNPKPCLPRPCTLRLKGRVPWRRLIRRIFPAPTRLLRCRRPYAGVSRSPRRTAKRAASPCRSENEAAGAQERGRPGPWTRTWGCCCGGGRQPPSACTPAAQKQFTLGRLSPQPWSPGAQSPNLLLTMVTKLWGGHTIISTRPSTPASGSLLTDVIRWLLWAQEAYTWICSAVLFVTASNWKLLNCPSPGDWLNKTVIYLCNRS